MPERRPKLNDSNFLAHLFAPKKNPLPTGLRKRDVKGGKDAKATRVRSYNKFSAAQQEVLKRTGLRDAYLAGNTSLADAKRTLRLKAVDAGIVKPLKSRIRTATPTVGRDDGWEVFHHLNTLNGLESKKDPRTIGKLVNYMTGAQREKALRMKTQTDIVIAARVKARDDSSDYVLLDGKEVNVFWYHPWNG